MLNGLDLDAYLRHVLERIADNSILRIAELLLWNVQLTRGGMGAAAG
jgi:uncharacterized membrane protein YsdA (DUF1294 family)